MPPLAYIITGFVNGDSSAVVSGIASVTSTARSTSYVGTYPIVVDTSALSAINYTFTKGQGSLVITKASLAVIPDAIAMTYGGAVPRLTYKISGLVNGDAATVVSGSPSLTANIPDGGAVGSYPISGTPGTLTAGNYFFVVGTGVLTINRAVLTVTAAPASMTYGGMVSPLSYKISGFVHGEDATVISGSPVLSTTCSSLSPVGACAILVSTGNLTAASYSFQTANGLLLVYKASLQVSATNASMTYGGTIPTLQYQITGFLNGDTGSVVSGQPVLAAKVPSPSVAGVYPIVIDVSGMTASNYVIAGVPGKFTVARATLTVTPANAVTSYGGPWPVFSYQITGFVNGDSVAVVSGGAALSSNANNRSIVGKYSWNAVTNSLWAANYTFLCGTGTLTIIPAVLTVVASPMTMTYGSATPSLGYGFSGFVNGDGPAAISGSPAESTVAAPLSPTGSYPITISAGTLSAANYTFVFVNGTMTVSRAVLKAVPANVSMMYGAAVPSLTYALQGFVNGDTQASATTGTAQLATPATSSSAVGQYDITSSISTLQAANYTFLLQTGKLSVAAAPLTVTANNQSMKVGATVPQLTFAITGFVNGDTTASATTGSPTLTTSATSTSSAGAYSISIAKGTMNAVNYQFTFRSGTLTVSK